MFCCRVRGLFVTSSDMQSNTITDVYLDAAPRNPVNESRYSSTDCQTLNIH